MPTKIIGTAPYQVSRNSDLGTLATQDHDSVNIQGGAISLNASSTQGYFQSTDVSEVKPSLLLDFANGKSLDSRVSFSRASTATYYDGSSVAKGEENMMLYSNDFSNSRWNKTNVIFSSASAISPTGNMDASMLTASSISDNHYMLDSSYVPASTNTITHSAFVKAAGVTRVGLREGWTSGASATFNLANGTVLSTFDNAGVTASNATITALANGWYRISVTFTGTPNTRLEVWLLSSTHTSGNTVAAWAGDNQSGIYVYGLQMEERSFAGPYVQTTTQGSTVWIPKLMTAAANIPRFDHNPVTGESRGLLVEEQKTNLLTGSEDTSNATYWSTTAATTLANVCVAPDGNTTADKLCENTSNASHNLYRAITLSNNAVYTLSAYLKAGERKWGYLCNTSYWGAYFDLVEGKVGSLTGNATSAAITPVGGGWYRCSITWTTVSTSEYMNIFTALGNSSSSAGLTYNGDGYSGIYVWGVQLELGTFASSYIPTTSSTVTRLTDFPQATGLNLSSSWYNSLEGTIAITATHLGRRVSGWEGIVQFATGNTSTNSFGIGTEVVGNTYRVYALTAGSTTVDLRYGTVSAGSKFKYVCAFTNNDFAYTVNGNTVQTDSVVKMPINIDRMTIGKESSADSPFNGYVQRIAYYPKRLSNAEMQEIAL